MTTPAVTPTLSIAADKDTYEVGDLLTLTAQYSDASVAAVTLHITASATDAAGNTAAAEVDVQVNTQAQQPMVIGVSDSFGDSYTQVSSEGGVAVLTTTVGTPPAPSA